MSSSPIKESAPRWPAVSWMARVQARPRAGAPYGQGWEFRIDLDAASVEAAMGHLGWERPESGEGEGAGHAFAQLAEQLVEMSTMMCAFDAREVVDGLRARNDPFAPKMAPDQSLALEGARARRPSERAEGSFKALWSPVAEGLSAKQQAVFWEDARGAAQDLAATMVDALERLGARPSVGWSKGFGEQGPAGKSRLPAASKGWERGVALRAQGERGEAWRALGPKASKALGRSALAKTFGPWRWFKLIGFCAPVWRELRGSLDGWSFFSGLAPGGQPPGAARQSWRCWEVQDPQRLERALEILAPGPARTQVWHGGQEALARDDGDELFKSWTRAQMEALSLEGTASDKKKARAPGGRRL